VALGSEWVVRGGCASKESDGEAWYRGEGRYSFGGVYAAEVSCKVGVREMMSSDKAIVRLGESSDNSMVAMFR